MFSANTRQSPATKAWDAFLGDWAEQRSAYSRGRQGIKYVQEHKENSPKAMPSLLHWLLRLSLLRAVVRGPARSSTWSCVGHTTRLVCAASGQGELGSLLPLVLWEGRVGREIAPYQGVWMSSLLCSPAFSSRVCAAPLSASSQWRKCPSTGGISGNLQEFT